MKNERKTLVIEREGGRREAPAFARFFKWGDKL